MTRIARILALLGILLAPIGLVLTAACHAPVTVVTPEGKAAFTADQIVLRINNLQNAAIQAEATGGLSTDTTRTLVEFAVTANRTLKTVPDGWQQSVATAWAETKKRLPPITNLAVMAAVDSVDLVLAAL